MHTYIHTYTLMNVCIPIHMIYIHMTAAAATKGERLGTERTQLIELVQLRKTAKKMVLERWMRPTTRGSWSLWTDDMSRERDFLEKTLGCWLRIAFDLRIDSPYWFEPRWFLPAVKKWIFSSWDETRIIRISKAKTPILGSQLGRPGTWVGDHSVSF